MYFAASNCFFKSEINFYS